MGREPGCPQSSSPARPATSAAGSCPSCSPPATPSAAWPATRRSSTTPSGPTGSRWCEGDVTDAESLAAAMDGVDAAYYLVHSMGGGGSFFDRDRPAATTFRDAAAKASIERIVYLGGLGRDDDPTLLAPPAEPPRGGPGARRRAGAGGRAAGRDHHRLGIGQLRDAALPRRGAPRDGHAPLGAQPLPADRHPRRARLPRRLTGHRRRGEHGARPAGARDRRARRPHLPRDDADLRRGRRPPHAAHPARAGAVTEAVVAVGRAGHAAARPAWPDRWSRAS